MFLWKGYWILAISSYDMRATTLRVQLRNNSHSTTPSRVVIDRLLWSSLRYRVLHSEEQKELVIKVVPFDSGGLHVM
jgi:hypothetical protein